MADTWVVSRSAIETRLRCGRERYLGYHYEGTGISRKSHKYEANFGNLLHDCMKKILNEAKLFKKVRLPIGGYTAKLRQIIDDSFKNDLQPHHLQHMYTEQEWLLGTLLNGWCTLRLPKILLEYDIVEVEKENTILLEPKEFLPSTLAELLKSIELPLRMDCLLRRKSDGLLFILDFKTVGRGATEDWNVALDNSLQSHLYVTAAEKLYDEPVGGIFYEGLVKGYRELDKAKSSQYNGQVIQYGSFLYGWKAKDGTVSNVYTTGKRRCFLPDVIADPMQFLVKLQEWGFDVKSYFPSTVPWKPIDSGMIIGSLIVGENNYGNNLEMLTELPAGDPVRVYYEQTLFEPNLASCFKYGIKHPCGFCDICHSKIHKDEIKTLYEPRIDHHK